MGEAAGDAAGPHAEGLLAVPDVHRLQRLAGADSDAMCEPSLFLSLADRLWEVIEATNIPSILLSPIQISMNAISLP